MFINDEWLINTLINLICTHMLQRSLDTGLYLVQGGSMTPEKTGLKQENNISFKELFIELECKCHLHLALYLAV